MNHSKKVLLVPLDWGLGHAARCVPIIQYFIDNNYTLFIGGTERTNAFFEKEFPELNYLLFNAYNINYSEDGNRFLQTMIQQAPKIIRAVRKEQRLLNTYHKQHSFDIIVSDNRFGLYSKNAVTFIMSHQLNVLIPQNTLVQKIANSINRYFIKKYNHVLVPDFENHLLAGKLSDSKSINRTVHYIGCLSRFHKTKTTAIKKGVLIILSGPEPQRTLLEQKIINQVKEMPQLQFTLLQAQPENERQLTKGNLELLSHLNSKELAQRINQAEIIISRTGYSTIMDLVQLERSAILIPTPGQTEQEYLGAYHIQNDLFQIEKQDTFNLSKAIQTFRLNKRNDKLKIEKGEYKKVLDDLLIN